MSTQIKIYIGAAILLVSSLAYGLSQRGRAVDSQRRFQAERDITVELTTQLREMTREYERAREEMRELEETTTIVETRPDGTKIETKKELKEKTQVSETEAEKEVVTEIVIQEKIVEKVVEVEVETENRSRYSAALSHPTTAFNWRGLGVVGGARLGNFPVFLELGYQVGRNEFTAGGRFEW